MRFLPSQKFLGIALFTALSARADDYLYDQLSDFDGQVRAYSYYHPELFGEKTRTTFVRRDTIALSAENGNVFNVYASFVSGTGASFLDRKAADLRSARAKLEARNFGNVSGRIDADSLNSQPLNFHDHANLDSGVDFANAVSMGELAKTIYFQFPVAAQAFRKMGFTEQYFIEGVKTQTEAAVLKNSRNIVVVFRGTEPDQISDWKTDAEFYLIPLVNGFSPFKVHHGFYQAFNEAFPFIREHIVSTLENKIRRLAATLSPLQRSQYGISGQVAAPDEREIFVGGHSLGGALSHLLLGELSLSLLDHADLGYYFVDPALKDVPDEKINQLIGDTITADLGNEQHHFSSLEEDDFQKAKNLSFLPIIESEAAFNDHNPTYSDQSDPLVDKRINSIITFGAPRSGNWFYKYELEKFASSAGIQIYRFENLFKGATFIGDIFEGDLVPRIPLANPELPGLPEYTHIGFRVDFETAQADPRGDPALLKCEYTDRANERDLYGYFQAKFDIGFHSVDLYINRIKSYLKAAPLGADHSCRRETYYPRAEQILETP